MKSNYNPLHRVLFRVGLPVDEAVATHLAIAVESLSHVELSRCLHCKLSNPKLSNMVCLLRGEGGSLYQLCAQPASGIWAFDELQW